MAGDEVFVFNRRQEPTLAVEVPSAQVFIGDVRDRAVVERFIVEAAASDKMPDLFFLNAGINKADHQSAFDLDAFTEVMDTNLNGVLNFIAAALPRLGTKPVTFVASSSTSTIFPNPNSMGYFVSKLAEARLFRLFDRRYRSRGWRFKTLILGPIATDLVAQGVLASRFQAKLRDLLTAKVEDAAARIARFVDSRRQTLYYTKAAAAVFSAAAIAGAILPLGYKGATSTESMEAN
jgi:NAD(P)-dependent dehydrogenase (short-subunit alcohol dehydrogenase family)